MQDKDIKKISSIVHASDKIKEASFIIGHSLSPMIKAGFGEEDLKRFGEKIMSIRAELSQLQTCLMQEIYKRPDS